MGELSTGRQEAYEIFKRDYEHNETIENNKAVLKQRYAEAKQLGEQVNKAKAKISEYYYLIRLNLRLSGLIRNEIDSVIFLFIYELFDNLPIGATYCPLWSFIRTTSKTERARFIQALLPSMESNNERYVSNSLTNLALPITQIYE